MRTSYLSTRALQRRRSITFHRTVTRTESFPLLTGVSIPYLPTTFPGANPPLLSLDPRSAGISQTHKNMSSQAPFVSPSNYFHPHQSHLQPFTSFASPVQSASGAIPYTHSKPFSLLSLPVSYPMTFSVCSNYPFRPIQRIHWRQLAQSGKF